MGSNPSASATVSKSWRCRYEALAPGLIPTAYRNRWQSRVVIRLELCPQAAMRPSGKRTEGLARTRLSRTGCRIPEDPRTMKKEERRQD